MRLDEYLNDPFVILYTSLQLLSESDINEIFNSDIKLVKANSGFDLSYTAIIDDRVFIYSANKDDNDWIIAFDDTSNTSYDTLFKPSQKKKFDIKPYTALIKFINILVKKKKANNIIFNSSNNRLIKLYDGLKNMIEKYTKLTFKSRVKIKNTVIWTYSVDK